MGRGNPAAREPGPRPSPGGRLRRRPCWAPAAGHSPRSRSLARFPRALPHALCTGSRHLLQMAPRTSFDSGSCTGPRSGSSSDRCGSWAGLHRAEGPRKSPKDLKETVETRGRSLRAPRRTLRSMSEANPNPSESAPRAPRRANPRHHQSLGVCRRHGTRRAEDAAVPQPSSSEGPKAEAVADAAAELLPPVSPFGIAARLRRKLSLSAGRVLGWRRGEKPCHGYESCDSRRACPVMYPSPSVHPFIRHRTSSLAAADKGFGP